MLKIVKSLVFVLFTLACSFVSNKSEARTITNRICVVPKGASGKAVYNGSDLTLYPESLANEVGCYN